MLRLNGVADIESKKRPQNLELLEFNRLTANEEIARIILTGLFG